MVTGRMRLGARIAAGAVLAVIAAGCGGILGDDEDDKSDSAASGETTAASSDAAAESTDTDTSAKEATAPKVVPRNAVMGVGGVPKLTYRVIDESRVRETITVWRGKKRLAIVVGEELTEAGRRTGVTPFTEAPWATKPEKLRWCVRAIDEHENRSKAVCAVLKVQLKEPAAATTTDDATSSGDDATSGATDEDATTGDASSGEDTAGSDDSAGADVGSSDTAATDAASTDE
jgi:hypothetical protein